jgi:argininosuccinate lyase
MMKGLPLAYNKDMQEDKEALFDAVDTLSLCLRAFAPMIDTLQVNADTMRQAIAKGFLNATLLANYLTEKGVPFREAYQLAGQAVRLAHAENLTLDELSLIQYQALSPQFEATLYAAIAI